MEKIKNHKSSILNLEANQVALISYLSWIVLSFIPFVKYFSWAVPLTFYFIEKKSNYVKKQSAQAFTLFAIGAIINFIVSVILRAIFVSSFTMNSNNIFDAINSVSASANAAMILGAISSIVSIAIVVIAVIASVKVCGYDNLNLPVICIISDKLESLINAKPLEEEVKEEKEVKEKVSAKKTTTKKATTKTAAKK